MTADDCAGAIREKLQALLALCEKAPSDMVDYDNLARSYYTLHDAEAFYLAARELVPVLGAALDAAEADKKNLNLIVDDISDLANAVHDVGYWDATKGESSAEYREASERASWLWDGMEQRAGRPVWKARPGNGEERPVETEGMFAFTTEELWAQLEAARAENAELRATITILQESF